MPYAYGAKINHEFDVDHLYVWLTFRHPMNQNLEPALVFWILEADEAAVDIVNSAWLDEHTLFLTSDTVAIEPTGVTLQYAGPSPNLVTVWGKQWEPWGPLPSYAGYPTAPALHNSTHENGGSDEIQVDELSGLLADIQHSFVDRGDPAAFDRTVADFTVDNSWHDLDLSAIVPAGAVAVVLKLQLKTGLPEKYIYFRKNGNVNNYNVSFLNTQVTNIWVGGDLIVAVDTARKVEYMATAYGWTAINLVVAGWWL